MTFSELLEQVIGAGRLNLLAHYNAESGHPFLTEHGRANDAFRVDEWAAIQAAIHGQKEGLFLLVRLNDAAVCVDPTRHTHTQAAHPVSGEVYTTCVECAQIRAALAKERRGREIMPVGATPIRGYLVEGCTITAPEERQPCDERPRRATLTQRYLLP